MYQQSIEVVVHNVPQLRVHEQSIEALVVNKPMLKMHQESPEVVVINKPMVKVHQESLDIVVPRLRIAGFVGPAGTIGAIRPTAVTSQVFNYTGASQSFTAPACIGQRFRFVVEGAEGGPQQSSDGSGFSHPPGRGRIIVVDDVFIPAGEVVGIYVGGQGNFLGNGGWNGGGPGGDTFGGFNGGDGGGASDVRRFGNTLYHRVIVAGGGGGHGARYDSAGGGDGGFLDGGRGWASNNTQTGGYGGTTTAGGLGAGAGSPGVFGVGGASPLDYGGRTGGAGGGGWWGGGGGSTTLGGGGGSSWVEAWLKGLVTDGGFRTGNGRITVSWRLAA